MASVVVELDDFAVAAWSAFRSGGDPLADALFRLTVALEPAAGMAGSDPADRAWAAKYDRAARAALLGVRAVANGAYRLASMFAQSARNYFAAESASDLSRAAARDVAELPGVADVSWSGPCSPSIVRPSWLTSSWCATPPQPTPDVSGTRCADSLVRAMNSLLI